jgi:hypothetical protein
VKGLTELNPLNENFSRVLSYRSYRLENTSHKYNARVSAKITSLYKKMKHSFGDTLFNGDDPIAVFQFLSSFKTACDHNAVSEGAAFYLFQYFLSGQAKQEFRAYSGSSKLNPMEGSGHLYLYAEAVQWFLTTYAREAVLADAYRDVTAIKQKADEDEVVYGNRLRKTSLPAEIFSQRGL